MAGIVNAARPVSKGRAEIDHGVEFEPVLARGVRVEIDSPEIRLLRALGQQAGFLIGVRVRIEQQNTAIEIDNALDMSPNRSLARLRISSMEIVSARSRVSLMFRNAFYAL